MLQLQPELAELKEQGVDLYVIAVGPAAGLEQYFKELELEASVIHDKEHEIFPKYDVMAVPTLLLIDKEGRAAFSQKGWSSNSYEQEILPLLTKLLDE